MGFLSVPLLEFMKLILLYFCAIQRTGGKIKHRIVNHEYSSDDCGHVKRGTILDNTLYILHQMYTDIRFKLTNRTVSGLIM
jgi:hypothetical protein